MLNQLFAVQIATVDVIQFVLLAFLIGFVLGRK